MKYASLAIKIAVWAVLMVAFLRFFTLSQDNSLSLQPDWFSGNKNSCGNGCQTLAAYSSPGFPVQIDGYSTEGLYWLAWTINIAFAVVAGAALALTLRSVRIKKNLLHTHSE